MMLYSVAMLRHPRTAAALLALFLGAASAGSAGEVGFVDGFEDLPLMPGLAVDGAAGVVFDKPSGRIVETVAGGRPNAAEIRTFYDVTLPELGWQPLRPAGGFGPLVYRRSHETLQIEIRDDRRRRQVHFFLTPG